MENMKTLDCGHLPSHHSSFTTGYGTDSKGKKLCYACCAEGDKKMMREAGKTTLYLVSRIKSGLKKWYVTNWPSSLEFDAFVRFGRHNIAGKRYDAWFWFEGSQWHGVTYGDNTQMCHCRKMKRKNCS